MAPLESQKEELPQRIPRGDLNAPPPLSRLTNRTTANVTASTCTLPIGTWRSSSSIRARSSLFLRSAALEKVDSSSSSSDCCRLLCPSSSSFVSSASPSSSSSPASSLSSNARACRSISSSSSSFSCSLAILVSSLSLVPSLRTLARPLSANIALVSALYILTAFVSVLYAVKLRSATRLITRIASGSSLFRNAPISAPAMVSGSITSMRSQSTSGRSARGWRFRTFSTVLATAPPKTVMFDSGMACLGLNPMTRM
mmetsp:Transcript_25042/g.53324  ORF Transcript_25042/g.53324 Transcript_25042/m.53324 type:complete len:256 (+) Transcript_25042:960-1727(+)